MVIEQTHTHQWSLRVNVMMTAHYNADANTFIKQFCEPFKSKSNCNLLLPLPFFIFGLSNCPFFKVNILLISKFVPYPHYYIWPYYIAIFPYWIGMWLWNLSKEHTPSLLSNTPSLGDKKSCNSIFLIITFERLELQPL